MGNEYNDFENVRLNLIYCVKIRHTEFGAQFGSVPTP